MFPPCPTAFILAIARSDQVLRDSSPGPICKMAFISFLIQGLLVKYLIYLSKQTKHFIKLQLMWLEVYFAFINEKKINISNMKIGTKICLSNVTLPMPLEDRDNISCLSFTETISTQET